MADLPNEHMRYIYHTSILHEYECPGSFSFQNQCRKGDMKDARIIKEDLIVNAAILSCIHILSYHAPYMERAIAFLAAMLLGIQMIKNIFEPTWNAFLIQINGFSGHATSILYDIGSFLVDRLFLEPQTSLTHPFTKGPNSRWLNPLVNIFKVIHLGLSPMFAGTTNGNDIRERKYTRDQKDQRNMNKQTRRIKTMSHQTCSHCQRNFSHYSGRAYQIHVDDCTPPEMSMTKASYATAMKDHVMSEMFQYKAVQHT